MSVSLPHDRKLSLKAACDNILSHVSSHTIRNVASAIGNLVCVFQLQNMDHCITVLWKNLKSKHLNKPKGILIRR